MLITDLQPILDSNDQTRLKSLFEKHCWLNDLQHAIKQINPHTHSVMDPTIRRDKVINNEAGETIGTVKVCRLPLPIQKKIVKTHAMFLGSPDLISTPKGAVEEKMDVGIRKIWTDNKINYKFKELVKNALSYRESAIIFFSQLAADGDWAGTDIKSEFKVRAKLVGPHCGDILYPLYDDYGDMIAFARYYKLKSVDGKEYECFDIETATKIYKSNNEAGAWDTTEEANQFGKIRIIYFRARLAWEDVQPLIERLEVLGSKHGDTNDYNGMPILVGSGKILSMSGKEESGKVVELDPGATLSYLTNNAPPESVKMELERLEKAIYSLTSCPDISLENLKTLGYFSQAAFKALFMDAHMNAADNEQIFGEGAQRMLNLLKAMLSVMDGTLKPAATMQITPKFTYFLPENFTEDISNIKAAKDAGILSVESAIKLNPLVSDNEAEIVAINTQGTSASEDSTVAKTLKALNGLSPLVANKVLESLTEDEVRALVLLGKKPTETPPPAPPM